MAKLVYTGGRLVYTGVDCCILYGTLVNTGEEQTSLYKMCITQIIRKLKNLKYILNRTAQCTHFLYCPVQRSRTGLYPTVSTFVLYKPAS